MAADGGAISLTAAFSDDMACALQNTNAGTAPAACSIICIDTAIDNLIGYVEGLGISSGTKRAIPRRLDKAAYRLCNGYPVSYVISTLNSVIDYVEYQSGGAIPIGEEIITKKASFYRVFRS